MAASLRKIDTWGQASVTLDGATPVELIRVAHVIDTSDADALLDAIGVVGIPQPWEAFPGRPEMRVVSYGVEPNAGRAATVHIRYVNKDYRKIRGGNAPEIVQRDYDIGGNQILMVYGGATYTGVVADIQPRSILTVQRYMPQLPYEGGVNIEAIQATYQQSVNLYPFFGDPGGYWMCESVDYETIGSVAYDVTFTFRGRNGYPPYNSPSGWLARTRPEDDSGQPIAGAPATYWQLRPIVDFGPLDLEP